MWNRDGAFQESLTPAFFLKASRGWPHWFQKEVWLHVSLWQKYLCFSLGLLPQSTVSNEFMVSIYHFKSKGVKTKYYLLYQLNQHFEILMSVFISPRNASLVMSFRISSSYSSFDQKGHSRYSIDQRQHTTTACSGFLLSLCLSWITERGGVDG